MSSSEPFRHEPACSVCGTTATRLEIFPPDTFPAEWDDWDDERRQRFSEWRGGDRHVLRYEGIAAGNGEFGTLATDDEARGIISSLSPEFDADTVRARFYDSLGYCHECHAFYCRRHWKLRHGYGHCPKGHGKSLDPHWTPEW